jgi:hypothetical protein
MQWTIRIEFAPGDFAPSAREVGVLTREELRDDTIGLTLEEGRRILRSLEAAIIAVMSMTYAARRCRFQANASIPPGKCLISNGSPRSSSRGSSK